MPKASPPPVFASLLLGLALLLPGCLRQESGDQVVLRFASAEPNLEQIQLTRGLVAEFERQNPGIRVETEFGIAPRKILVQTAARVGPDIFLWWFDLQPLVNKGVARDLAPLAAEAGFDWSVFHPYLVDYYKRGDAIHAFPVQLKTYALVYNRDLFDAAGEPYPDATWTWDRYREVARRLTIKPERGPATQFGNGPFAQFRDYVVRAHGGDWFHRENGRYAPDTPENRRAVSLILALLRESSPRPEDIESFGGGSFSQAFLTGKVAMQIAPAWMMSIFTQARCSWDVVPAPRPAAGEGRVVFDDAGLVMNSRTAHPEAAFKFLSFYAQASAMKNFAAGRNGLAARRDANEPFLSPEIPGLARYLEAAELADTPIKPVLPDGDYTHLSTIVTNEFERLFPLGEIDEDEFFRRLERRLNVPASPIARR